MHTLDVKENEHMPTMRREELKAWILDKLSRHGHWEARHTALDNVPKGAPKHMRKEIAEAARELIKAGLVRVKPTAYGQEVSLVIARKDEIHALIAAWKLGPDAG